MRVIAATQQGPRAGRPGGAFREDLFYRLNVFPITLPPLRERPSDIPLLVQAIVDELCETKGNRSRRFPVRSLLALQRYHWPGNIRELRNVVERAMITTDGPVLHIEPPAASVRRAGGEATSLKALERAHILEVLEETGWRIRGPRGAAVILGLPPTTLENRMMRLGIARPGQNLP